MSQTDRSFEENDGYLWLRTWWGLGEAGQQIRFGKEEWVQDILYNMVAILKAARRVDFECSYSETVSMWGNIYTDQLYLAIPHTKHHVVDYKYIQYLVN